MTLGAATACAAARTYEFRVRGHLDDHWAHRFGDLTLTRRPDGTSTLAGAMLDQAQLHGVLAGLRDIGVTLLAVHVVGGSVEGDGEGTADAGRAPAEARPVLRHRLRRDHLTLRPAASEDAEATFGYRSLESVSQWLTEVPTDLDAYRATFTDPTRLANTVVVEHDGQLIGDVMLRLEDAWAQTEVADQARGTQAELGWVLDPTFTGYGYATEAVRALLDYCFGELRVRRVVATCFLANDASWRLMERLGMRREVHAVGESLHRSGQWLDSVGYAILAEEWTPSADTAGTASSPTPRRAP